MEDVRVEAASLRRFVAAVLETVGMEGEDAGIVADVLVAADLRGHESHGVARLEGHYVRHLQSGRIRPRAALQTVRGTASTLVLDAGNGMGHPAARRAMELCIARARQAGSCVALVRHSNHYGMAGYYPLLAAAQNMIGFCCSTAGSLVVPTGGRSAMLGTNPIAFAAPAGRHRPFMLDMATSVVPIGKVEVKARRETPLPPGWALDPEGRSTTDAAAVLEHAEGDRMGGLLPLGGLEAGHKGYGLAAMVDIAAGLLAGAPASLYMRETVARGEGAGVGHLMAAIDIDALVPLDEFKRDLDAYIDDLHHTPPAAGTERVMVAGEPEFEAEEQRLRDGLPLHAGVAASLQELGRRLGVPSFELIGK